MEQAAFGKAAVPQKLRWGVEEGRAPGISIVETRDFIPWNELQIEVETKLIHQVPGIPVGSTTTIADFRGRKDWIIHIFSPDGEPIAHLWFGSNPKRNEILDGMVHIGFDVTNQPEQSKSSIWETYCRYSDGTYRRVDL